VDQDVLLVALGAQAKVFLLRILAQPGPGSGNVVQRRAFGEARRIGLSLGGHRPVGVEDGLEVLVEVLYRNVTQPVEDTPDPHSGVGVRVGSRPPLATRNLSVSTQAAGTSGAL
jgi:hypothetical protein